MKLSQEEIDEILDEHRYMAIVNASGWPTTKMLTPSNKAEFLSGLIQQEVVYKRDSAIAAFGRGLELLSLLTLIRQHPEELRDALVYSSKKISSEDLYKLIISKPPLGGQRLQAYRWFMEYIWSRDAIGMLQIICILGAIKTCCMYFYF